MDLLFIKSIKNAIGHWYIPMLVGVLFILVSVVSFVSPLGLLLAFSILFSLSFLLSGISEIIFSIANRDQLENWGWTLGFGIITGIVGLLLLLNPIISTATLAFYVGFVILFRSIAAISFALDVKKYGSRRWGGLMVLGVLGAVFSFVLLWNPLFAGMSVVVLVALSFLFAGLFNIYFSFQLRKLHKYSKQLSPKLQERVHELQDDIWQEWQD